MKVADIMTREVWTCRPDESLSEVAQMMWDHDCGALAVIGPEERVVAMITDRDICMAAHFASVPPSRLAVVTAMSKQLHAVREDETLEQAEAVMRHYQVRRVPVVDRAGRLKGIVTLTDLARRREGAGTKLRTDGMSDGAIVDTLSAINEKRTTQVAAE